MVTREGRCDCVVEFVNGFTQRCVQSASEPDGKCYLHSKYFAGLCSPTTFDADASVPNTDTVRLVKDSSGRTIEYI